MKNSLDFNIQFSNLMGRSFPNCFAGVYVYLENIFAELPKKCGKKMCFGCACSRDPQSAYFAIFDTMCGKSSLYWRFDGVMTDMAALIGDNSSAGNWSGKCGTDYTVDFLFGFAGYEYKKITDIAMFKKEIITAIDSGKPVLVDLATDDKSFAVITGYDGNTFISSYYYTDQGKDTQEKLTTTLSCDEIKTTYTIGNKVTPRYTLKDGLERIKQVIESTFNEKVWDDGIEQVNTMFVNPTDEDLGKMNADDLNALKKRITETLTNQFHCHIFSSALNNLPKFYDIEQYSELPKLLEKLRKCIAPLSKYAFNRGDVLGVGLPQADFGKKIVSAIADIKKTHSKMLELVKKSIMFLEK